MRRRSPRAPGLWPTPEPPSLFSCRANPATFARPPVLQPSERTAPRPPSPSAHRSGSLKTSRRRRRLALRSENSVAGPGAETIRGPLLPNHTLSTQPLLPAAALLLRQTPLLLPFCNALLAMPVLPAPSALAWLELRCCPSVTLPSLL